MKNAALKKQVEVAACPRAAMKMAAKDAAMKKMHSPAKAMKTPMKKMDAPTKAMKESATKFNAELKKASAEGKLKGKFKEAVDSAPMKKMDGGKKGEAGMTKQDRKVQRLQKEIIKARDEGNDRRITEIYKEMREMYKADKNKSPNKAMKESPAKLAKPDPDKDRRPRPKPQPEPRPRPPRPKPVRPTPKPKPTGKLPARVVRKAAAEGMAEKFKAAEGMREAYMKGKKPGTGMKSPMKKDGTKFVDKVKSAGRALKDNLFKPAGHGDIHNTLTRKISRSYKKYKKGYRESGKGK